MRTKIIPGILAVLTTSGCVTAYSTMSTHTIEVGPSATADVVWVLESNRGLLRCYESQSGPVCVRAKMSDTPVAAATPPAVESPPAAAPPPSDAPAPTPAADESE